MSLSSAPDDLPNTPPPFEVSTRPLAALTPHPRNYRRHPEDQLLHLMESIRANGVYRNIVIANDDVILAGHGVVEAAARLGLADVPVVVLPFDSNDVRALKVVAADNEIAHLGEVNDRALTDLLKEILDEDGLLGTGFDEQMLANLVMITRPASEIRDLDEASHWVGLPVYEREERRKLIINFENEDQRTAFMTQAGFTGSGITRIDGDEGIVLSTWWPEREMREDLESTRFEIVGECDAARSLPRYPIYIPSKGRAKTATTPKFLMRDRIPFYLVVEPQEADAYAAQFGADCLLVMPQADMKLLGARNWIMDHALAHGHARHWQLDDNIRHIRRWFYGRRIKSHAGVALRVVEDLSDRYENVGVSGLNYMMFGVGSCPPFFWNVHVYSCTLINNAIDFRWRLIYNDDTDLCLQALAKGWCTLLVNAFLADKAPTMKIKGGNTDDLYQGDGRLHMARSLERMWPGVVSTGRRFHRPQHIVYNNWKQFDTPLVLKPGIDLDALRAKGPDEYGLTFVQHAPTKSVSYRRFLAEHPPLVLDRAQKSAPAPAKTAATEA